MTDKSKVEIGDRVQVIYGDADCGIAKVKEIDESGLWIEYEDGLKIKLTSVDNNITLIKIND